MFKVLVQTQERLGNMVETHLVMEVDQFWVQDGQKTS